ncbi:hypothetical protein [Halorussus aquaticus]|uniref:Uncharacterized protein n=1 Tax=Halorussus aquaticus TaxID=2953748 RepID=A0ABD5Q167_9EURY|nr:hypothetical protein [Halorussus aquaticus]
MPDTEERSDGGLPRRFDCTDCTDYEAEYGLDLTDLDELEYRSEFCERIDRRATYRTLPFDQECRLLGALGDVHGAENVCPVLDPHYRWKVSSHPKHGYPQHHEHLFKQTFDVECDVRGEDPPSYRTDPAHRAVAGDIYCVTQAFLDRTVGRELTVYRGLSRHAGTLVARTLRAETERTYEIPASVLKNFTASEAFTSHYSPLVLQVRLPRTAVAIAADHLAKYREDGTPAERDDEYRVFGDELGSVAHDQIYLVVDGTRTSLFEFFTANDSFTTAEHRCYVDAVRHLADDNERVTDDPGFSRIADWYATLTAEEYEFAEAIEGVVNYVVGRTDELPDDWRADVAETFGDNWI